ncbi:Dps family protein [Oceanibacterium hippocampi]|uniref:DNA protection during starvation protein 2 n=1 Tax=Oceanibacterium hippocampi TaxID=745714 RepID=A0A1Y5TF08_9PROT|nr:DNA starvation/stationary phase protection protein [Oceanibacterium hippocampi]SLN62445.1 DNA protection during starvation protein 2 [Oceanibacterium hippocampi]
MSKQAVLQAKPGKVKVKTGIPERDTGKLATCLSRSLADTYILYLKTQGTHWNAVGPLFYGLHNLTEAQYEDLAAAIDDIAERIRAIGHVAPSSFAEFEKFSELKSEATQKSAENLVRQLVADNQAVAERLRHSVQAAEEIDDVYTADLLTARIGAHEQAAWMLRSILAE